MTDIPQFVPQHVCLTCDGCCRFKEQDSPWRPKVAPEEVPTRGRSGLIEKIFSKELDADGFIRTVSCSGQIQCAFFQPGQNTCRVYTDRPFECRLYPFLLMRLAGEVIIGVHLSCPHVQEQWGNEHYKDYVGRLRQYFKEKDALDFIRRNPLLVRDYSMYEREIARVFSLDWEAEK
jgi:Fe-S-cluster containining protein